MKSYATLQDLQARLPGPTLRQLAPSPEDPGALDARRVLRALEDASAEVNGYLAARYTLPLPDDVWRTSAAQLIQVTVDIALYRLCSGRTTGDIDQYRVRFEDAKGFLEKVNSGRLVLGPAAGSPAQDTQSGARPGSGGVPVETTQAFSDRVMAAYKRGTPWSR